ncbi:hypothetical protein BGW37DRAFT_418001 [Umbelopsis sp. PMI_123]|nr:hypothetical protein BGW37DRAFT_418001 [Umbelopsis sp. PMI_123]
MIGCCGFGRKECVFCDVNSKNGFKIVYEVRDQGRIFRSLVINTTLILSQENDLIAFHDRSPASKLHLLIIPRQHIGTVKDLKGDHRPLREFLSYFYWA